MAAQPEAASMRIALIADTHLSARSPECVANWHAARRAVERLAPDRTINLGDITLDGQTHPEELEFAVQLVRQWPATMLCVPGNHDIGNASGELPLDRRLLATYVQLFGPDRWVRRSGPWLLLGVNAQLFGSATDEEEVQWAWIEEQVDQAEPHTQTVLFLHRPLLRPSPGEFTRKGRYVVHAARERLLTGALRRTLRMVVSGHTHQYLDLSADGVRHVWMPSLGFIIPDHMQTRFGEKVVGLGLLDLSGHEARFDLWCPDGMHRHEVSNLLAFQEAIADRATADAN